MNEDVSKRLTPQDLLVEETSFGGRGSEVMIDAALMGEEAWGLYCRYIVSTDRHATEEERQEAIITGKEFKDLMGFSVDDLERAMKEREKKLWQDIME